MELSIVLVILGLLTGGILAGQSLIRAAELRAIPTEYNRYLTATQTFRDKYLALPGDMNNATRFWNRQTGDAWCAGHTGAAIASPGTCNGNGDGIINSPAAASQSGERFQFWRHLALAGMMEGTYTGIAGSSISASILGENAPISRISNVSWEIAWVGAHAGTTVSLAGNYGNRFAVGTIRPGAGPWDPFLTPEEAWNIDTKTDDGKPGSGRVLVTYWSPCTNSSDPNDVASDYIFTQTGKVCALYFVRVF